MKTMDLKKTLLTAICIGGVSWAAQAGVYEDILHAAEEKKTGIVIDLLRRGMDVNTVDPQGTSLAMIAARNGNLELVRFLIDNRANLQRRNRFGDTALMLAAIQGHSEIVRLLLERKVEINSPGWNALHYAAIEGRTEIALLLLATGANGNLKAPNGQTALMLASKRGHLAIVKALLDAQVDPSVQDPDEGTALDMAGKANHPEIVELLKGGAKSR